MTLVEIGTIAKPKLRFKRASSPRALEFGWRGDVPLGKPFIVVDYYGMTAALFSDDLMADDWEVVP